MKKGQSATESMVLITLLTFLLIASLAAVSDDIIRASNSKYENLLNELSEVIEREAQIALSSEDGYYHQFTLPPTLNGLPYIVSVTNSTLISGQANFTLLGVASQKAGLPLNVTKALARDVRGTVVRGVNTIGKEENIIVLRPLPLTSVQGAACSTCSEGIVTLEECCDHGYAACCQ